MGYADLVQCKVNINFTYLVLCKTRYFGIRLNSYVSQPICKILTMVLSHAVKNKKHRALMTA
ncbi:hypothetical protein CWB85_12010 [Pseudoalteromonas sp. S1727]|nr:hypothetical protein CWB85_12010 [Pseudoalteromonas sp. S1727]